MCDLSLADKFGTAKDLLQDNGTYVLVEKVKSEDLIRKLRSPTAKSAYDNGYVLTHEAHCYIPLLNDVTIFNPNYKIHLKSSKAGNLQAFNRLSNKKYLNYVYFI